MWCLGWSRGLDMSHMYVYQAYSRVHTAYIRASGIALALACIHRYMTHLYANHMRRMYVFRALSCIHSHEYTACICASEIALARACIHRYTSHLYVNHIRHTYVYRAL